jgi:hypothetical protein
MVQSLLEIEGSNLQAAWGSLGHYIWQMGEAIAVCINGLLSNTIVTLCKCFTSSSSLQKLSIGLLGCEVLVPGDVCMPSKGVCTRSCLHDDIITSCHVTHVKQNYMA